MTLRNLAHGAPGLLFDQEYGVVAKAPVLMLAFVGLAQMLRAGGAAARRALELMFILAALLVTVGAFQLWWGGSGPAGRPVASGVLLLGLPIASLFVSAAASPSARAGCHVLLATSVAMAGALAAVPDGALLHNDRDGSAALLEWASPTWPLWPMFPSFIAGSLVATVGRTVAWLALAAGVAWLIRFHGPRGFGGAALATLLLGFAGSVVLASLSGATMPLPAAFTPEGRARVPLLDRFDGARRPTAILYDPLSLVTPATVLSRVTLRAGPGLRTAPQPLPLLWNARFALPAGGYRVRLSRRAPAAETTLALQIGRAGPALEQWDVTGPLWEHQFTVPLDAVFVGFRAPSTLSAGDGALEITPVHVVDESKRLARPSIIGAQHHGPATVFFHDDFVFPEPNGYWTRGRATTDVTYATNPGSSATVHLRVHCGPVANELVLRTPAWEQRLVIEPGAASLVAVPTTPHPVLGIRLAAVQIAVRHGFVPADFDRASTDRRRLGCWIGNPS
jgi:hypothetical protein